jgi:enoyl-CoA hydratase
MIATAEMIDAAEAYRLGIVNKVVSGEELMSAAGEMMNLILANGPLAVAVAIEAVDRGLEMSLDEGLVLEANHFGLLAATADMTEGMNAFLEKRAPVFRGK